jgi:predicted MFS family arabinose efflux permease
MAPAARGTAVSLFAAFLFMGQSVGVLLAAALVEWLGSAQVIVLGAGVMLMLGLLLSVALKRRDDLMHLE